MAKSVKPEYPCSQKDLYSILETGWDNFDDHQADFVLFKALYTPAYSTAAKAAIAAAKALPDDQARGEEAESLRVELVTRGETCRQNFQKLKSYITTAYPDKAVHKAKFEAAGQLYYNDASNEDWESVELMNQSGSNFIAANTAALTAGNNMPAGFQAIYDAGAASFAMTYNDFKDAEQTSEATAEKIKANNGIYRTGIGMMKDGQIIYADKAESAVKFTFQSIWDLINPPVAGLKGNVKRESNFKPIEGAQITAQQNGEPEESILTDGDGNYSMKLSAGNYTVMVSAAGYVTQSMEIKVETGNYRTLNFTMAAI